jgi:hypothetical protein
MPVTKSLTVIEAILDGHSVPYAALIIPGAQHNLTIQPEHGQWVEACTRHGPCKLGN